MLKWLRERIRQGIGSSGSNEQFGVDAHAADNLLGLSGQDNEGVLNRLDQFGEFGEVAIMRSILYVQVLQVSVSGRTLSKASYSLRRCGSSPVKVANS